MKKNCVVVSMDSFAFLGAASALTTSTTEGPANASDITQTVTTHDKVETKTTTRTIKLVDKDTKQEIANVEPIKQTVNWTRTNKVDDQGNVVSEGTWQAVDDGSAAKYAAVKTPSVKEYDNPNPAVVAEQTVNSDTTNETVVVTYADEQAPAKPKAKVLPSTIPGLPAEPVTPAA